MKRVNITCPYCGSKAFLRPASVVYGAKAPDLTAHYYACARYPDCNAYVAAHKKTKLPMGTLANPQLRYQRVQAHAAFNRLWQDGYMSKKEAYRWLQIKLGLPEEDAHIAKFSTYRCKQVIQICADFSLSAIRAA